MNKHNFKCNNVRVVVHALVPAALLFVIMIYNGLVASKVLMIYFLTTPLMVFFVVVWGPITKSVLKDSKLAAASFFLGGILIWSPIIVLSGIGYLKSEGMHDVGSVFLTFIPSGSMLVLAVVYSAEITKSDNKRTHRPEVRKKESEDI